jgi:aminoglycoside 6'-N-acetyltransferase
MLTPPSFPWRTSRLVLRPLETKDADVFSAYRSDPLVAQFQGWEAPFSLEQAANFILQMQHTTPGTPGQWYQIGIERQDTHELVGDCAFQVEEHDPALAEIGYTLARAGWGQGYATEAVGRLLGYLFDELEIQEVIAICDELNVLSGRVARRLGMVFDDFKYEPVYFKGRWCQEHHFHLRKEDRHKQ